VSTGWRDGCSGLDSKRTKLITRAGVAPPNERAERATARNMNSTQRTAAQSHPDDKHLHHKHDLTLVGYSRARDGTFAVCEAARGVRVRSIGG
jgi:hypothetical protein